MLAYSFSRGRFRRLSRELFGWLVYRKVFARVCKSIRRSKGERSSLSLSLYSCPSRFDFCGEFVAENFRKVSKIPSRDSIQQCKLRRNNPIYPFASLRSLWSLTYAPFDIHFLLALINERISICTSFVSPFVKYLKPVFALSFLSRYVSGIFIIGTTWERMFFRERERERGGRRRGRRKSTYCFSRVHCVRNCVLRWLHIRGSHFQWMSQVRSLLALERHRLAGVR